MRDGPKNKQLAEKRSWASNSISSRYPNTFSCQSTRAEFVTYRLVINWPTPIYINSLILLIDIDCISDHRLHMPETVMSKLILLIIDERSCVTTLVFTCKLQPIFKKIHLLTILLNVSLVAHACNVFFSFASVHCSLYITIRWLYDPAAALLLFQVVGRDGCLLEFPSVKSHPWELGCFQFAVLLARVVLLLRCVFYISAVLLPLGWRFDTILVHLPAFPWS